MPVSRCINRLNRVFRVYKLTCPPKKSLHTSSFCAADSYSETFRAARDKPEEFWARQAEGVSWHKKWDRVLDDRDPVLPQWFPGGMISTPYNCIDRHVEAGFGDQVSVIYDSPITNSPAQHITYSEFMKQSSEFSVLLSKHGVKRGDRVLIYMPMIPEALVTMLGTARLGAIHSLVFGGFAARELSTRIAHAKPKVIVTASCGVEPGRIIDYAQIVKDALKMANAPPSTAVVMYQRPGLPRGDEHVWENQLDWMESMESVANQRHDCVPINAMDPLYLLYTSGTTGLPKAVVRPTGGHAVSLHWSMEALYGMSPGEVWWAASDLGWVVGHSYICYAPLLHRNTTVLYEGKPVGTPDSAQFFRVLSEHQVASMFVAPTALRAIKQVDPEAKESVRYRKKMSKFRILFLAGERCDNDTLTWSRDVFGGPVLDHWWQTESGSPITAHCVGLGNRLYPPKGTAGRPVPGYDVHVLGGTTQDTGDQLGRIVVKLPLPPGFSNSLWENDEKYKDTYFKTYPGYYDTMDAGCLSSDGYISVMSRDDDVINVAGHRLSSGALEEAALEHPDLAECAVVAIPDQLKGHVPLGLLVLKSGSRSGRSNEQIIQETKALVRKLIGPVASFKMAAVVKKLPKTRSGKVARNTIAAMAAGQSYQIPVTIEDDTVYKHLKEVLTALGMQPSDPDN